MLQISEADVERLLDMPAAIGVVEEALRQLAIGGAVNVPRVRAQAPGAVLHSMSAIATYLGAAGWKCYLTSKSGAKFYVGLCDAETGELLSLIEADRLGQIRTGAATGVAVKHLTDSGVSEVGLFGTGWQAQSQLEAVATARPIRRAVVYSRDPAKRENFARAMSSRLSIEVVPANSADEAVRGLPIVVTATTSKQPIFDGRLLEHGALVCAIGSNWLHKAEIDLETFRRATSVVCDSVEACRNEAGDLARAAEAGVFQWESAVNLGEIVAGQTTVPRRRDGVIIFKCVGLAIEDVAVATHLLRGRSVV